MEELLALHSEDLVKGHSVTDLLRALGVSQQPSSTPCFFTYERRRLDLRVSVLSPAQMRWDFLQFRRGGIPGCSRITV